MEPKNPEQVDADNAAARKKSAELEALLAAEKNQGDLAAAAAKVAAKKKKLAADPNAAPAGDEAEPVHNAAEEDMEPTPPGKDAGLAEIAAYAKALREYRKKKAEMAGAGKQSPYPK